MMTNGGTARRRELDEIIVEMLGFDDLAARRYVNSVLGLIFQLGVMHRTVDALKVNQTKDRRAELFTRFEKSHELIMQYLRQGVLEDVRSRPGQRCAEGVDDAADEMAGVVQKVSAALAASSTWAEVQAALAASDLEYFERGGGLGIRIKSASTFVCKASQAGPGYMALIRKFGTPFPGHCATWLAEKALKSC